MPSVIVVGSGSAGGVLAARLSEDPAVSVLVLEAGPYYPSVEEMPDDIRLAWRFGGMAHDWGYSATGVSVQADGAQWGVEGGGVPVPRGKVVGGSSSVNGSNALRAYPSDFARWVGLGNDVWSWEAVLPYFRRMENDPIGGDLHGTDGPVPIRRFTGDGLRPVMRAFVEACEQAGHTRVEDLSSPGAIGTGSLPVNQVDGVRMSTAVTYLIPALERPNLELRAEVTVDRVQLSGGRARAVLLTTGERLEADLIVLAGGAVGSPIILQRSGVGPVELLERHGIGVVHALPGVGRNLRDHPMLYPTWSADADAVGPLDPPLQAFCVCTSSGTRVEDQIDLNFVPFTLEQGSINVGLGFVRPYSVGRLEIASADPDVAPEIHLQIFSHQEDLQRTVTGFKLLREIFAQPALAGYVGDELWPGPDAVSDAALADAVMAAPTTYAHVLGTCSMGQAGADWAVVDQRGKVHGLEGLHVVDASIMPTIPAVPPNMTVIMMAERCAEFLREELAARARTATAAGAPAVGGGVSKVDA
jgi:choline dehydrogenase-like flavoprotein